MQIAGKRVLVALVWMTGCTGGAALEDGGSSDAARMDAAPRDAAGLDATIADAARSDAARSDAARPDASSSGLGLRIAGNRILLPDGTPFHGRGANLHDTRGCDACTYDDAGAGEVIRRLDALTDDWGANFVRLLLESYPDDGGFRNTWQSALDDPEYLADLHRIVSHATAKPGVYVLVSLWIDPSFDEMGWPTDATRTAWRFLARELAQEPKVLFGLVNEPEQNFDGSRDAECWDAMDRTVQAIRDVEDELGVPHHVIAVQGTGAWSRRLDYYVTHPITAGGGDQIAYETHVYDPSSTFADAWIAPAATLPVIIGEHGPAEGYMTEADCMALHEQAEAHSVPWLAWTFHGRCPPNLLVNRSGCGVGEALDPTPWGRIVRDRLAMPW